MNFLLYFSIHLVYFITLCVYEYIYTYIYKGNWDVGLAISIKIGSRVVFSDYKSLLL